MNAPSFFATAVRSAAGAVDADGWFGPRKCFISAVFAEMLSAGSCPDYLSFRRELLAAHRAGELILARADLVAAMDADLVASSEVAADGATFHFVVVS